MKKIILIWAWFLVSQDVCAVVSPTKKPWLRLDHAITRPQINRQGSRLAFVPKNGLGLRYVDLKSLKIYKITPHKVGASFFWAPDGFRVVYRIQLGLPYFVPVG